MIRQSCIKCRKKTYVDKLDARNPLDFSFSRTSVWKRISIKSRKRIAVFKGSGFYNQIKPISQLVFLLQAYHFYASQSAWFKVGIA